MTVKTPVLSASAAASLTSLLEEYTSFPDPRLPGTFLTVTSHDPNSPLFLEAKGARNVSTPSSEDPRGPVSTSTLLFVASCTKSIVAVALLLLFQEGKIKSLDDSVDPWIPEMRANGVFDPATGDVHPVEKGRIITIRMLMDHTSGSTYPFKNGTMNAWSVKKAQPSAFTLTKGAFIDLPLLFQPGTSWGYGYGLDWAGLLIERLLGDGTTFSQFAKTRIFDPLGMKRSTFHPRDLVTKPEAEGGFGDTEAETLYSSKVGMNIHWHSDGPLVPLTDQHEMPAGIIWKGPEARSPDYDSGGAGLISTIEDYGRFLSYLVSLSQYPSSPAEAQSLHIPADLYIEPTISRELFTPHLTPAQVSALEPVLAIEGVASPKGGYGNVQHSTGLAVFPEGSSSGASKGTCFWSGITCLFYIVDPEKKIGMMLATQILPYGAPKWRELLHKCIRVVYDDL